MKSYTVVHNYMLKSLEMSKCHVEVTMGIIPSQGILYHRLTLFTTFFPPFCCC